MRDTDRQEFKSILVSTMSVYGNEISADVMRIWWAALSTHSMDEVRLAFSRHIQDTRSGRFAPKPADILSIIEAFKPDGRLGADEAWAMIPHDEASSAVITDEMAEALRIAQPLIDEGDMIAARMTFKEAYSRIVATNKSLGKSPRWFASLGHDPVGREAALNAAVEMGRLSADHAQSLLPSPKSTALDGIVQGLLADKSKMSLERMDENRHKMVDLKQAMGWK